MRMSVWILCTLADTGDIPIIFLKACIARTASNSIVPYPRTIMRVLHHLQALIMIEQHFAAREASGVSIHIVSHKHFQKYMVKIHSTLKGASSSMPCRRSLSRSDAGGLSGHTRGGRYWDCSRQGWRAGLVLHGPDNCLSGCEVSQIVS